MDIEKDRKKWLDLLELECSNFKEAEEIKSTEVLENMGYAITQLVPVEIKSEGEPYVIFGRSKPLKYALKGKAAYNENSCKISIGGEVGVYRSSPLLVLRNHIGSGRVVDGALGEIKIRIKPKKIKSFIELFKKYEKEESTLIDLVMSPDYITYKRCQKAIRDVFTSSEKFPYLHSVLMGFAKPRIKPIPAEKFFADPLIANSKLNTFQLDAVKSALEAQDVYLIHGPPGTGKTLTLSIYIGMVRVSFNNRK